jgi:hypothetical protein
MDNAAFFFRDIWGKRNLLYNELNNPFSESCKHLFIRFGLGIVLDSVRIKNFCSKFKERVSGQEPSFSGDKLRI